MEEEMNKDVTRLGQIFAVSMLSLAICLLSACAKTVGPAADQLNPFAEDSSPTNSKGARTNEAILGASGTGSDAAERARHALEVAGSYRRAHAPQPVYPVMKPAEVRLMWIPDHLTTDGNLVPAHYYYLKVRDNDWAVQDAFEIEGQLDTPGTQGDFGSGAPVGGATPWVYKGK